MYGNEDLNSNKKVSKIGYVPVKVIEEYRSSVTGSIIGYLVTVGTTQLEVIITAKDFIEEI